ncbi:hypothetical protein [Demequina mangrovi]|uniref:Uncharacterized protein n=1 Tax=Demequina mangrovi TaxID=1043493 RepID=A0A1H6VUX4_9MICO|nr:hypothetical protein [Demequina mangrovi]SEJ08449.1 hypothetical protein SAMN05421637_0720 [Demequina mangrovi]
MEQQDVFSGDYVASCRWRIEAQIAAFDLLRAQAPDDGSMDGAIEDIEDELFNAMAGQLEGMFAYRDPAIAPAGPGPLRELTAVVTSLNANGGRFDPPEGSGLDADTTVLGIDPGDAIRLDRDGFQELADAFFDALEEAYSDQEQA